MLGSCQRREVIARLLWTDPAVADSAAAECTANSVAAAKERHIASARFTFSRKTRPGRTLIPNLHTPRREPTRHFGRVGSGDVNRL